MYAEGEPAVSQRILVVDDETPVLTLLTRSLEKEGFHIIANRDGAQVLEIIRSQRPEMVILDINLPLVNGLEVCRRTREISQIPIIIISGRSSSEDKLQAFTLGADDYITKPLSLQELLARVRAVLRRSVTSSSDHVPTNFRCLGIEIDFQSRCILSFGREVKTTPIEFDLLKVLTMNSGKVLPHRVLLRQVWGPEYGEEREYLRVHLSHLRRKLEPDPSHPRYIQTVPRVGYRFNAPIPIEAAA